MTRDEHDGMFVQRDSTLAAHRDGEYVLWFEADLYDQLRLIQILERLRAAKIRRSVSESPSRRESASRLATHRPD